MAVQIFPPAAIVSAFVRIPYQVFCKSMKKTNIDPSVEGLELSRQIFKKLQDVEDLIEIIAREIKRQLDLKK
jgi:hypothetical protein